MNKIFTSFLLLCGISFANAQTVTVSPADSIFITAADSSQFGTINGLIFLHNNEPDSITIKWHLLSDTIPTGWAILFCDNQNCYQLPTAPKTSLPIAPGDSIDMHAEFDPACIAGSGTMRIGATAYLNGNSVATFTLTYQAAITNACATAINKVDAVPQITVFPNPASDLLSIEGVVPGHQVIVQFFDLQGRLINSASTFGGNKLSLNVSTLQQGMYVLKLSDIETSQSSVTRFTKL